jgi:hypothetical protein
MESKVLKRKANLLRRKGFSFKEIAEDLKISKSTASLWLKDVELSKKAKKRIINLGVFGRKKGIETNRKKREMEDREIINKVESYFEKFDYPKFYFKISCVLLYWCEGTKHKSNSSVSFTNADPEMIKYFLHAFRSSFKLDEKKFRALVHLHEYHNEKKQLKFWSDITNIPLRQFHKSYLKKNTGKNKKENYPGCISVRYFDIKVYKELIFTIKKLIKI